MTDEEIQEHKDIIDNMDHFEMCKLWRFAALGHIYMDNRNPLAEYFKNRLFNHFGGFTPEISKALGW